MSGSDPFFQFYAHVTGVLEMEHLQEARRNVSRAPVTAKGALVDIANSLAFHKAGKGDEEEGDEDEERDEELLAAKLQKGYELMVRMQTSRFELASDIQMLMGALKKKQLPGGLTDPAGAAKGAAAAAFEASSSAAASSSSSSLVSPSDIDYSVLLRELRAAARINYAAQAPKEGGDNVTLARTQAEAALKGAGVALKGKGKGGAAAGAGGGGDDDVPAVLATQADPSVKFRCPILLSLMVLPMRSKVCGHLYDNKGIQSLLKNKAEIECPIKGCGRKVTPKDLEQDEEATVEIEAYARKLKKSKGGGRGGDDGDGDGAGAGGGKRRRHVEDDDEEEDEEL
jgi:hypothetical protein